jgi:hypothetical protein
VTRTVPTVSTDFNVKLVAKQAPTENGHIGALMANAERLLSVAPEILPGRHPGSQGPVTGYPPRPDDRLRNKHIVSHTTDQVH